jgi:hypothetical protein
MLLRIADNLNAPAALHYRVALWHILSRVVGAFYLDVGANFTYQGANVCLRKEDYCIHVSQGANNFRAFIFRHQWPALTFELASAFVRIDGHDETAAELLCRAKVSDMPNMEQVKASIAQDDTFTRAAPFRNPSLNIFSAEDL